MTYDQYAAEIQRLQDALAWVAKEAVPQWTSTKDRMPPRNGNYLVVTEGLGFYRGCAVIKLLYFYNGCFKLDDKDVYSVNITHWMPLPEPPKEDDAE